MCDQFERLRNAFAITIGDRLLAGTGAYPVGAIACVLPGKESAVAFCDHFAEDLATLGGPVGVMRVADPWELMRRAAGEGLAGIEGADSAQFPGRFMFMVRVEEAGAQLPTVLAAIGDDGWGLCLTRTGERQLEHAEVLHWTRYDILDDVSGSFGQRCPFRGWDHGQPLYELRGPGIVLLLASVPLLADWNSVDGAFAFFQSKEEAEHYLRHRLGDGQNRLLSFRGDNEPAEGRPDLCPVAVPDLRKRLEELTELSPFLTWCISPDAHREDSACGRLNGWPKDGQDPAMNAVSGLWRVRENNVFELETPLAPWSGRDTVRWSGGQSLTLGRLDRTYGRSSAAELNIEDMTDAEVDEVLKAYLDGIGLEDSWEHLFAEDPRGDSFGRFHILCWDSVTGEGRDFPWVFDGFMPALRHLTAYEREHDRVYRVTGASACGFVGFSGSGDAQFEDLRSARFQLGVLGLARRAARQGYRPSDAADLVALCNAVLTTLHVDYAGVAADLLDVSDTEQQERLLEELAIDEEQWRAWADSAEYFVDPVGEELALTRMAPEAWKLVSRRARHFIATALVQFSELGRAPQLDYASINLEVVKALEVELNDILAVFRADVADDLPTHSPDAWAEEALARFIDGGSALTLGAIPNLFRDPGADASELRTALFKFLNRLPNGEFLTSSKFAKKGLQRVTKKYRNGGVHESRIPFEVAVECLDMLVGTIDAPGFTPRVAHWRTRA